MQFIFIGLFLKRKHILMILKNSNSAAYTMKGGVPTLDLSLLPRGVTVNILCIQRTPVHIKHK